MERNCGTHVLVVDDEPGFRELLTRILESAGCEVRTASDAHAALRSVAELAPAVAICDIHMPGPDGVWLARQIRAECPTTAIVLATSDNTIPPVETLRKGMVAYILKPFQRRAVVGAVAEAFRWAAAESGRDMPVPMLPPEEGATSPNDRERGHGPAPVTVPSPAASRPLSAKRWLIAFALLCAAAAASLYIFNAHVRPAQALARVRTSSCVVITTDAAGARLAQGSGFFVGPDTFVTNYHVVNGAVAATVSNPGEDGPFTVSGIVAIDRQHDLVLLKTSRESSSFLTLSTASPALGDEVSVYGAPLGLQGTLSRGIISAEPTAQEQLLQISAPISPGSSGSPLLNAAGEVIGVVTSSRMEGQNLNFAVPAVYVSSLVRSVGSMRPLISATRGAGNDLERNQLLGVVRMVTVFPMDAPSSIGEQPAAHDVVASAAGTAGVVGRRHAVEQSGSVLIFDRQGRLLEETPGDVATKTQYEYDDAGRLKAAVERDDGDNRVIGGWRFSALGPGVIGAVGEGRRAGWTRRIEYQDDGRVLSDEVTAPDGIVVAAARWMYDEIAWPIRIDRNAAPADTAPPAREEHDAVGNLVRRVNADGTDLVYEYRFDARGNWISRETTHIEPGGTRTLVRRERRDVQYW